MPVSQSWRIRFVNFNNNSHRIHIVIRWLHLGKLDQCYSYIKHRKSYIKNS